MNSGYEQTLAVVRELSEHRRRHDPSAALCRRRLARTTARQWKSSVEEILRRQNQNVINHEKNN